MVETGSRDTFALIFQTVCDGLARFPWRAEATMKIPLLVIWGSLAHGSIIKKEKHVASQPFH